MVAGLGISVTLLNYIILEKVFMETKYFSDKQLRILQKI